MRQKNSESAADAVMRAALDFRTPWFILATSPLLWLSIFIFWGGKNLSTALWFSVGVVGTAVAWSIQGWEPWNMALNQVMRGRALRPNEYSTIQQATAEFFKTRRLRLIQGAWIAAGALIPWLISGTSLVVGGRPFRPWPQPIPWWGMVIAGIGEAIRGRAIALYVLAGQLQRSWPDLLKKVAAAEDSGG